MRSNPNIWPRLRARAACMNRICPQYEIDNRNEFCHFLAHACHGTDHFRTLRDYATGKACEGRRDLGNTQPGDSAKFKGCGISQTTGRANHLRLGLTSGRRDMFVNEPQLFEMPEHAVWSACVYWKTRGLNNAANHDDGDRLKKKYRGRVIEVSPMEFIGLSINGQVQRHAGAEEVLFDLKAGVVNPDPGIGRQKMHFRAAIRISDPKNPFLKSTGPEKCRSRKVSFSKSAGPEKCRS